MSRSKTPSIPEDSLADPDQLQWGWSDDDEEESEDEEDVDDDDLPAPPPAPRAPNQPEKPRPPPESTSALGPPPDDTVAAAKWAYMMHMRHAYDANEDTTLSPSQRRKEVRVILAGAAKHMGDAMRYDVKKMIEKQNEQLEAKRRGKAQAKLQKRAPAPSGAKIIPIRRG